MEPIEREKLREKFAEVFGAEPRLFRAPGRVNLIGEHTDYNDGFVLPFAIDRESVFAGRLRDDAVVNVRALDIGESATFDLSEPGGEKPGSWMNYIEGTARSIQADQYLPHGADLMFSSSVPIGSGLSSSAAIEISVGFALLSLNGYEVDRRQLAFAAQRAEHEYAGTRSGIMDQFTSVFARSGHALLLDCRSLEIEQIPLEMEGAAIAVCDTKVKHELATSEYNTRRTECEDGVRIISKKIAGLSSLRDLSRDELEEYRDLLPDNIYKRCRHVVTENARTLAAAGFLREGSPEHVGELMFLSHESLRDDYEVSSPELDLLVEIAQDFDGAFGARMTGGGFGGCTVNLIKAEVWDDFRAATEEGYSSRFGIMPEVYRFQASDGASEIT